MNRCAIGAKVSAFRLSDTIRRRRIVGTLHSITCDGIAYIVEDGKRIACNAHTLKRARKVRHNEYRFGNRVTATHQPIIGR